MKVVGLTGGIASGKSTVAALFRARGVPVVDADAIAREIVMPGEPAYEEIVRAFGDFVVAADRSLDRKKLGSIVFADPAKRRVLESITHPRILARSQQRFAELSAQGHIYALYEAALLIENGSYKMFPELILVAASEHLQLHRLQARDGLNDAEAEARIAAQMPLVEKIGKATHVIWNDGEESELAAEVALLDAKLRAIPG